MLFDFTSAGAPIGDALIDSPLRNRWSVDSEYGRLTDVMLSAPPHLELVPCNAVSIENHRNGVTCAPDLALAQHSKLAAALEAEGVRCHLVPPAEKLPDLSFTRDATMMTPWGLLGLNPAVGHRGDEVAHILETARSWGIPVLGQMNERTVEGGDVCILRPGVVIIGWSGDRTDEAGANALARIFEERGWRAILYRFDPHFLHLDTQFTVLDRSRAVACVDVLDPDFVAELRALDIDLVPVTYEEVQKLGGNLLSLGDGRVCSSADNLRVNEALKQLGYKVIAVEIDQFTRCGGGIHCLTMPLARLPG
jgi:N-dimethylarginine dimethylaminohydrolase